jgi:hypothetical protein
VFVSVDYDFLELRTLAQACLDLVGGSELAKAIRAGEDPHLSMAAEILGIPYSEALARKKDPAIKDARQLAKAANFGLPGGMGPDNFRAFAWATYRVRLSARQAARALFAAGFQVRVVEGSSVRTRPAAGVSLRAGSTVQLETPR